MLNEPFGLEKGNSKGFFLVLIFVTLSFRLIYSIVRKDPKRELILMVTYYK